MEIRYHGHSCFQLSEGDISLIIDPFLAPNNPKADATADDITVTHLALTHGHADHVADAVAVASRNKPQCVAMVEVANWLEMQGVENVSDPNLGGTVRFDGLSIKLVPAWHTNTLPGSDERPFSAELGTPIGTPSGLIIEMGGLTIYDAGDTCLFGDMELIGKRHGVDVALLPIGGHYTMDREDAAYAAELIGAKRVIPIHYDTFPPIETDAGAFAEDLKSKGIEGIVLNPGETAEL
ncbi:MAG: metal-dependent hydrolase [Solirubrobacterales bacterium]|nr:metal-dependent hydrolase [Solirubrobacterales bacterium]MCB8914620.1 metal-dependent hydrolase [Thermoleophilales bacterium]